VLVVKDTLFFSPNKEPNIFQIWNYKDVYNYQHTFYNPVNVDASLTAPDTLTSEEKQAYIENAVQQRKAKEERLGKGVGRVAGAGIGVGLAVATGGLTTPLIPVISEVGGFIGQGIGRLTSGGKVRRQAEAEAQRAQQISDISEQDYRNLLRRNENYMNEKMINSGLYGANQYIKSVMAQNV